MDPQIFNQEKNHFDNVISLISKGKVRLENAINAIGASNLEHLKELRENPETNGADFFFFLEQLHEKNRTFNIKGKFAQLEELSYLLKEPYFARIDLSSNSKIETFYIGKFGYVDRYPVVTDWRAKVASVYYRYRYPQKNVSYDTPNGKETRDLLLKRTFEIDNYSLLKYYNNDLQLDESEIISEKIEQRTGGVLEDIVETIQVSQMDIIEADPRQACIVQGCVGSGKSTVAIHKMSHIFFNFPNLIHPDRSILIAKNQILVGYLSTLFPKLGLFNLNYSTIRELLVHIIFREELPIKINFDAPSRVNFQEKDFYRFQKAFGKVHKSVEASIEKIFDSPEFSVWGGFRYSDLDTPYDNLTSLIEEFEEEVKIEKDEIKEDPESVRAEINKQNIKIIRKILARLREIRSDLKNKVIPSLLKKEQIDPSSVLDYQQTLIYIFVYCEILGFKKYLKYEYCVVDEAQDVSILEYAFLNGIVLHGRFALFGDLNQSFTEGGLTDWAVINDVIKDANKANVFTLDTNYRSTKPIIEYANNILSTYTKKYLPKSINRKGKPVEEIIVENQEEMFTRMIADLEKDTKPPEKSIGIIAFDGELFERLKTEIKRKTPESIPVIELQENSKITYIPRGIYVSRFNDVKGLEFAKVYILGLNLKKISNFIEAKKAFVATTRAMNELRIYGVK